MVTQNIKDVEFLNRSRLLRLEIAFDTILSMDIKEYIWWLDKVGIAWVNEPVEEDDEDIYNPYDPYL